jgi:hypothetical protein
MACVDSGSKVLSMAALLNVVGFTPLRLPTHHADSCRHHD